MRKLTLCLWTFGAALSVLSVFGAESEAPAGPADAGASAENRGGRSRSGMRERMEAVNRQLKEKYPAEYAELEKLRETDRFAAFRKMSELAQKAGIEMPFGRRGARPPREENATENREWQEFFAKLKEKFPTEFDAVEKKFSTDPQTALKELKALAEKAGLEMPKGELPKSVRREGRELNRNRNRIMVANANRILARTRPEDYAKLQALREVDDDEARAFFRRLVREEGLTPARLLGEPFPRVQSVSYSDKDIEAQNPPTNTNGRGWGGWGGRGNWGGGWGGNRGNWGGGRGGFNGPPRF